MEAGVAPLMQWVHRTPWIYDGRLPDRHAWRHPLLAASTARTSLVAMELLVFAGFGKRCFLPRWRPASVVSTGRHLQCVRSATVAGCLWGILDSILLICCQRLSVMGSHSAFIPMSGAPDSLLVFSTHCAQSIFRLSSARSIQIRAMALQGQVYERA